MTYRVIWEIDIEADSPREAAEKADAYRHRSMTPSFTVRDEAGEITEVDLAMGSADGGATTSPEQVG